jgi:hypothetical protein
LSIAISLAEPDGYRTIFQGMRRSIGHMFRKADVTHENLTCISMQAFCFMVWLPARTILRCLLFILPIGDFLTS